MRRGLIARASSGGNSSSSISISGWSRGTRIEALGLRLAIRGRSDRPRRSVSASDIEEDDESDDMCMRPPSFGCGKVSTGKASVISVFGSIKDTAGDTRDRNKVQGGGVIKAPRLGGLVDRKRPEENNG